MTKPSCAGSTAFADDPARSDHTVSSVAGYVNLPTAAQLLKTTLSLTQQALAYTDRKKRHNPHY